MVYNPQKHHRRSIRLQGYDYTQPGAYFVTICIREQECLLGNVENRTMVLSECGRLVERCWRALPRHFPIELDEFVVMPNHVHGIIIIGKGEAFVGESQTQDKRRTKSKRVMNPKEECFAPTLPHGTQSGSLGAIIQNFKSVSARKINRVRAISGVSVWQRNYYERIVRNEDELNRIRCYIMDNPTHWETDENNPKNMEVNP